MIAIDLGSNTVRAIKYDCASGKKIATFEKIVKAADKVSGSGVINDEAKARIFGAIEELKQKLGADDNIVAAATAVYRKAKNGEALLKELSEKYGIKTKILNGESEALLTSMAVEEAMKKCELSTDSFMLVDIGGGSTEIIFKKGDKITLESFEIGIVGIAQKYPTPDMLEHGVKKECAELKEFIKDTMYAFLKPQLFCATAGTPTTIAAIQAGMTYENYDSEKINGAIVTMDDIEKTFTKLLKISIDERSKLVGALRQDLITAGILIYKEVFDATGFKECRVFDDGLREGVALAVCNKINIF